MHTEVSIPFTTLYGFLIVLARVSGFLILVPLPGLNAGPSLSRAVLAFVLTIGMMPLWPTVSATQSGGQLAIWAASQFVLGLAAGVALALLLEAFQVAGQAVGLQAGFSYASTVDPSTQADTAVLQTVLQLFAGTLFFTMGLDRHFLRLLAAGLPIAKSSTDVVKVFSADAILQFGSTMLTTGLRFALPVMGFLVLLDLAFALLAKVHAQMQLLSFSFSAKMLAGLALFAATLSTAPSLLASAAHRTLEVLIRLLS